MFRKQSTTCITAIITFPKSVHCSTGISANHQPTCQTCFFPFHGSSVCRQHSSRRGLLGSTLTDASVNVPYRYRYRYRYMYCTYGMVRATVLYSSSHRLELQYERIALLLFVVHFQNTFRHYFKKDT
jgi:hypothetical protein